MVQVTVTGERGDTVLMAQQMQKPSGRTTELKLAVVGVEKI
jgi:hypothetical protein